MIDTNTNPIKTVLIIVIGLIIIYLNSQLNWTLYLALTIAVGSFFSTKVAYIIDYIWMKLAWLLSLIVPKVILTCVFYLILFPIATVSKILGVKNGIILTNNSDSAFKKVNKQFEKATFEKPW